MRRNNTYRMELKNQERRLWKIKDEIDLAIIGLEKHDLLTTSYLDWALLHISNAIKEIDFLRKTAKLTEGRDHEP